MEDELPVEKIEINNQVCELDDIFDDDDIVELDNPDIINYNNAENIDIQIIKDILQRVKENPELARVPITWTRSILEWYYAGVATQEEKYILNVNSLGMSYRYGYDRFRELYYKVMELI